MDQRAGRGCGKGLHRGARLRHEAAVERGGAFARGHLPLPAPDLAREASERMRRGDGSGVDLVRADLVHDDVEVVLAVDRHHAVGAHALARPDHLDGSGRGHHAARVLTDAVRTRAVDHEDLDPAHAAHDAQTERVGVHVRGLGVAPEQGVVHRPGRELLNGDVARVQVPHRHGRAAGVAEAVALLRAERCGGLLDRCGGGRRDPLDAEAPELIRRESLERPGRDARCRVLGLAHARRGGRGASLCRAVALLSRLEGAPEGVELCGRGAARRERHHGAHEQRRETTVEIPHG